MLLSVLFFVTVWQKKFTFKEMYGKVYEAPSRSAFIIDTDGTILGVIEKVNTKAHAEELKELVESL